MSKALCVCRCLALLALALTFGFVFPGASPAQQAPALAAPQAASGAPAVSTAAAAVTAPAKFDGHLMYREVFEFIRDRSLALLDPVKRAAWVAGWEHRHDHDGLLDTQAGTDKACQDMIDSLGERYNFYLADGSWEARQDSVFHRSVHIFDEGRGVYYIKVDDFRSAYLLGDWSRALFEAAAGKALVIDLRGNLGGRLDYAESMAETLLAQGTLIEVHSRNGESLVGQRLILQPDMEWEASQSSACSQWQITGAFPRTPLVIRESMPIVVLVDHNSYSASETLSGALQANHRAYVVGEVTGGKGVGQYFRQLGFKRAIDIISMYMLPGGQPIDWVGIIPNDQVKQPDGDTIAGGDPKNDTQLREALRAAQDLIERQNQLEWARYAALQAHKAEFERRKRLQQR